MKAGLAQLVEQGNHNPWVNGSSPLPGTSFYRKACRILQAFLFLSVFGKVLLADVESHKVLCVDAVGFCAVDGGFSIRGSECGVCAEVEEEFEDIELPPRMDSGEERGISVDSGEIWLCAVMEECEHHRMEDFAVGEEGLSRRTLEIGRDETAFQRTSHGRGIEAKALDACEVPFVKDSLSFPGFEDGVRCVGIGGPFLVDSRECKGECLAERFRTGGIEQVGETVDGEIGSAGLLCLDCGVKPVWESLVDVCLSTCGAEGFAEVDATGTGSGLQGGKTVFSKDVEFGIGGEDGAKNGELSRVDCKTHEVRVVGFDGIEVGSTIESHKDFAAIEFLCGDGGQEALSLFGRDGSPSQGELIEEEAIALGEVGFVLGRRQEFKGVLCGGDEGQVGGREREFVFCLWNCGCLKQDFHDIGKISEGCKMQGSSAGDIRCGHGAAAFQEPLAEVFTPVEHGDMKRGKAARGACLQVGPILKKQFSDIARTQGDGFVERGDVLRVALICLCARFQEGTNDARAIGGMKFGTDGCQKRRGSILCVVVQVGAAFEEFLDDGRIVVTNAVKGTESCGIHGIGVSTVFQKEMCEVMFTAEECEHERGASGLVWHLGGGLFEELPEHIGIVGVDGGEQEGTSWRCEEFI